MTAYHAETDPLSEYDRVALLHISPKENSALKRARGELSRFGDEVFEAFGSMIDPAFRDRFISLDTSTAFACLERWSDVEWAQWLRARYPILTSDRTNQIPVELR